MAKLLRSIATLLGLAFSGIASAATPAWALEQIYTNSDGSVQFAVFATSASGQQYLAGHTLIATPSRKPGGRAGRANSAPQAFTFPRDLPGDSANRRFLVATQAFADLQLVRPDYVVPNNFFPLRYGAVSLAGAEAAGYASPPTDGVHALHGLGHGWIADVAEPTNFAGEHYIFAGEHWVVERPTAPASASGTSNPGPSPAWQFVDAYSSRDRSVQFVVFTTPTSGLQFLRGQTLTAGTTLDPDIKRTYTFPSDLPGDSAGHSVLIATRGFADLGVLTPDYVVPNGFFTWAVGRGYLQMGQNSGMPLILFGSWRWTDTSIATNYAGQSYSFGSGTPISSPPAASRPEVRVPQIPERAASR